MSSEPDLWGPWRRATPARVGLGRTGDALPVKDVLDFQLAHAKARDAVHTPFDVAAVRRQLDPLPVIEIASAAQDRGVYLRRPDLGRRLGADFASRLTPGPYDIVFVIGDGLSAAAVQQHAAALLAVVLPHLRAWSVAPVVIASQARVALGDEIGERLQARLCVILIGERPGLSVANSLGAYITYDPRPGRKDSERNCISNIHGAGLTYQQAAEKLAWLVGQAFSRRLTGVNLKDDAGDANLGSAAANPLEFGSS
jgi:ethanolamine ammonia-lyase small subunit